MKPAARTKAKKLTKAQLAEIKNNYPDLGGAKLMDDSVDNHLSPKAKAKKDKAEARTLKSIPANVRDVSIHTTASAVQQQKAPEREKTPQQEQGQKPPQREIQRGYGIGLSL